MMNAWVLNHVSLDYQSNVMIMSRQMAYAVLNIIKTFVRFLMAHTTHWNTHVHIWRRHRTHTHTHTRR